MNISIHQNRIFLWFALATLVLLLIPLLAMQFTDEVNWGLGDFLIMGVLIFGFSSLFILVTRKIPIKKPAIFGFALFIVFLIIWAELAVGILIR